MELVEEYGRDIMARRGVLLSAVRGETMRPVAILDAWAFLCAAARSGASIEFMASRGRPRFRSRRGVVGVKGLFG